MIGGGRVLAWFSCGAASAVAADLAIEKYGIDRVEVCYCDTLAYEHPDNRRFIQDVTGWLGKSIAVLKSKEYADIYDVFLRTRWLVGVGGARCTTELKKVVRKEYQRVDDIHVFGFTCDEESRVRRFNRENPEMRADHVLFDRGVSKNDCFRALAKAGIALPQMYRLGYKNNNCIGCVKGQTGYWNKIRIDFPETFWTMAVVERELDAAINKRYETVNGIRRRVRVFLDELDPKAGRYATESAHECGVLCGSAGPEETA